MKDHRPHQRIVSRLMIRIFKKELNAGDKLPPLRRLSEEMAADTASLRIALKHLEGMNLVEIRRSDGVYVKDYMQDAGLDFLSAIFRYQEADDKESLVDKYLVDEVWEFWVAFLPEVVRMAARKLSASDIRELTDTMDRELENIHDREKLIELEVFLQDRVAEAAANMVVTLWFNSTRPLRKKMIEMFIRTVSADQMKTYIMTRKQMVDDFMAGDMADLNARIDGFREVLQQLRRTFHRAQQSPGNEQRP